MLKSEPQITQDELRTKTLLLIGQKLIQSEEKIEIFEGQLENALSKAICECKRDIGQLIIDVLEMRVGDIEYYTIVDSTHKNK